MDDLPAKLTQQYDGGGALAAMMTNESRDSLSLAFGAAAPGLFKASSVVIGGAE